MRTGGQGHPTPIHTPTHNQHSNIHKKYLKRSFSHFSSRVHGRTNGPTDQRTDGRTMPLIELRVSNQKIALKARGYLSGCRDSRTSPVITLHFSTFPLIITYSLLFIFDAALLLQVESNLISFRDRALRIWIFSIDIFKELLKINERKWPPPL